ncbi:TPA: hypothetical protein VDU70_002201 [Pseudomonas aeruginosa]|nr:hypothetical protein [Pseudomonas aeruginosa]HEK3432619.1 hypothetical protein [Pseudomonas aeruginosa]HEP8838401.1 hypothetical protein [Pseudomonas aeruginosa]HEP8852250.1 hypothetical protein [Pseudomonas aeruginosa]
MSKFKAGDLALSLSGPLMGQAVELIRFVNPGDIVTSIDGQRSYVFCPSEGIGGWHVAVGNESVVQYEKHLMPLRGDFQPEQQKAKGVEA